MAAAAHFSVQCNMKPLAWMSFLGMCIAMCSGCSQPARGLAVTATGGSPPPLDVPVPVESPNYSNVVATANRLVSNAGLNWGTALKVVWQPAPLNRYLVTYATPQSELGYAGYRAVHVETNWDAWFPPRG